MTSNIRIFVDADGCPVKQEVYKVATRYQLQVILVANTWMNTPLNQSIELVVVNKEPDAADDWIVEHVQLNDIVVTSDIPLASRSIEKEARVLSSRGRIYTENDIGEALATRDLQEQLRSIGIPTRGPSPLQKKHRSQFLQSLDKIIQQIYKKYPELKLNTQKK